MIVSVPTSFALPEGAIAAVSVPVLAMDDV